MVAEVRNRLRAGSWVVDEEHVTGGGRTMDALVAYEVRDGLIRTVLMLT